MWCDQNCSSGLWDLEGHLAGWLQSRGLSHDSSHLNSDPQTDGSAVSMDPGGSRVKMEQAWWWCPLCQPVWGDPGFPAMWLLLHGGTDHPYLPRGKLLSGSKVPGAMGKGSPSAVLRDCPALLPGSSLEGRHAFVPSWSRLLQGSGVRVQRWNQGHPMTNFRVPTPCL